MVFQKMVAGALAGVVVAGLGVAVTASDAMAATCTGKAKSDFNGDGISDVAVGEPGDGNTLGDVHVLYGTRSGLRATATTGTPDDQIVRARSTDFGSAVVALDFNGDGCSDLAIAAHRGTRPGARVSGAGFVAIYFGSTSGLITTGPLNLDGAVAGHTPAAAEGFGSSLAAGNFNRDNKQDLIIGAPGEEGLKGAVYIVPGATSSGLRFVLGANGVPPGDGGIALLGAAVAAGDFNGDGNDDLAAGAPVLRGGAGGVVVMNGSGDGSLLAGNGGELWTQDTTDSAGNGISGNAEPADRFGTSLAAGDFNGNHTTDLAIGVPREALGSVADAGMVNVIYSAGTAGLSVRGNQGWSQNTAGISDTAEAGDNFGQALVAGDFNGNGRTDLAIGVPSEAVGSAKTAGMVNVVMGSSKGLASAGQQAWSQNSKGITGSSEEPDAFGSGLAVGRTHSAGRDDLVIGAPGEALGAIESAGTIHMIPGSSTGLTATGSQGFNLDTVGVEGTAIADGLFGSSVS